MAHEIADSEPVKKQKKYTFKLPELSGKFGLSFNVGKKEFFIGLAVATIEIETVVRKRRSKVFIAKGGKSTFVEF